MSDFVGREDLLTNFLQEASELLSEVSNKLQHLGQKPDDICLPNDIFLALQALKGGAERLDRDVLVTLCHLTENLFDRLRHGELSVTAELMDTIMAATQSIRGMLGELGQGLEPRAAAPALLDAMILALFSSTLKTAAEHAKEDSSNTALDDPDWPRLHAELIRMADLTGPTPTQITDQAFAPHPHSQPARPLP